MWTFIEIAFLIVLSMICVSFAIVLFVFLYKYTYSTCRSIIYKCETCDNCLENRKDAFEPWEYYCVLYRNWKHGVTLCDNYCKKQNKNKTIKSNK